MKFTKILFIPLVMVSLFAFANAANCTSDAGQYYCEAGQSCSPTSPITQCECNGTMIASGSTCGSPCVLDAGQYYCIEGQYCTATSCECDGAMIASGALCQPAPTPPISCTWAGRTISVGQTMQMYQFSSVPYASGSCGGVTLTCTNNGGVGLLTPIYPAYSGYTYSSCIVLPPPTPPTGSCTVAGLGTIASGASITGYLASSVSCGGTCSYQIRTCINGSLSGSGTYNNLTCTVNSCGGGGGGSSYPTCTSSNLVCVNNVRSRTGSNYCQGGNLGKACTISTGGNGTGTLPVGSIVGSPFSTELNNAYLWAYSRGITTMKTIQQANMTGHLLRSHMAKMISVFAVMLADIAPDTTKKCTFTDIASQSTEMKFYIKLACQLGLMGVDMTKFSPKTEITRAQFGTILSRVIWGIKYNDSTPYYTSHLNALKAAAIMTQINNPTTTDEIRGYVMVMMKRTYEGGFLK